MVESQKPGSLEASREGYLTNLFQKAKEGNAVAMDTLSKIALGGHGRARELVQELDRLHPPIIEPGPQPKLSTKDYLFIATHPIACIKAAARQAMVAIEHEGPPASSTIEEFPNLTVVQAARMMMEEQRALFAGGVPKWAWSREDQKRMERGELPMGHPEHPNV